MPKSKKEMQAAWYAKNAARHKENVRLYKIEFRAVARAMIIAAKNVPCVDCRQRYATYVMDFDHRPGQDKVKNIAAMLNGSFTLEKIRQEIAKCDVVCSNCHRIRTFTR